MGLLPVWCVRGQRRPAVWTVALVCALVALPLISGVPSAAAACSGRALLQCPEKQKIGGDYLTWTGSYALDLELAEITLPRRLRDASLLSFWRAEAASAAARSLLDLELDLELPDPDFETIAVPQKLKAPKIRADKVLPRRDARLMSQLLAAEFAQVADERAMLVSLDRASNAATDRNRADWQRKQLAVAAGYARQAAGVLTTVMRLQPRVTRALERTGLRYGVGPADMSVARRQIRRHGLNGRLRGLMRALGMNRDEIAYSSAVLSKATATTSFTLALLLSDSATLGTERGLRAALLSFAHRTPPAPTPNQ